jgi:hypothetical protein
MFKDSMTTDELMKDIDDAARRERLASVILAAFVGAVTGIAVAFIATAWIFENGI